MNGWVKLHRSILDWEWYEDTNVVRVFLHLILTASTSDKRWRGHEVKRGTVITSLQSLSDATKLSVKQVRTVMDKLKRTGEVAVERHGDFSVVTIKNYDLYQREGTPQGTARADEGQTEGNLRADEGQTEGTARATSKEYKNIKNVKEREEGKETKKERIYYPGDPALDAAFRDYVEMRKKIRAPMTDRAIELQMRKLQELATDPFRSGMDNDKAIKILEQSTMNNWKALYDLKPPREERDGEVDLAKLWRDVL